MGKLIGADSLGCLSREGLLKAIGAKDLCMACFDRNYPTPLFEEREKVKIKGDEDVKTV